jgi:hypothetical protein
VVATITGLMLEQLATDAGDFGGEVMRPALDRLLRRLAGIDGAPRLVQTMA